MKFKIFIFAILFLINCVSNSKYESLLKSYEESKLENQRILGEKGEVYPVRWKN
ncbi:OmpA family protein [Leptospira interrogans serovar Canicola]|nr:OmpA family protein [Leptospira interrogans serovar Canicola]